MAMVTDDIRVITTGSTRTATGLVLAVVSAASFGLSGALARGLLATGWTPGAVSLVRIAIAAVVLAPFGAWAMRGQWHLVRRHWMSLVVYGLVAVATPQFAYFSAVAHMEVAPALLIEFTAPAAVVVWLWLRKGERPGRVTLGGAVLAALGLALLLDLASGTDLSMVGVAWALVAMVGCATYFLLSADDRSGVPPIALASGGLLVAALSLALLGITGVLPMRAVAASVDLAGSAVAWWVPVALLGVVTAALSYVTGIAAIRRLGSRLASFVALLEAFSGVLWAWVLLDELPRPVQLMGGVLILAGVVAVKLGEGSTIRQGKPSAEHPEHR
jgi:drug/metabolite transporter (DMT)-like permease